MSEPPIDDDETRGLTEPRQPALDADPVVVGNYRIVRKLGSGGMGEVYEALQERPIRRTVALKLVKWGMDTRRVLTRFESERQALALMDHPNIARVFDAGATDQGRPFFVMESVAGVPITTYCDSARLVTRERLELFVQVCEGIQHAHQKGIIHRDVKPSNLLVTIRDGRPVPKIIDFGLAKAIDDRLSPETAHTEIGRAIGTPEYMSPEQADASALDVDTRTDVYSLGVVLYELLVGALPFDVEMLRGHGFSERCRRIHDSALSRPSLRLSLLGNESVETASRRRTDLPSLRRQLRGDLDWIVMKAVDRDRSRRYETAHALALDIRRHLADEPVQAGPPSTAYRLGKFVRRNRVAVGVTTLVLLALVAGATGTALQAVRARAAEKAAMQEAQNAVTQASRAEQTSWFLRSMLASVNPSVARGRDTTLLREILEGAAQRVGTELDDQPEVQSDIRATIGTTYRSLGLYDEAEVQFTAGLGVERELHGDDHPHVATALASLASLMWDTGRLEEAEAKHREALGIRRGVLGDDHTDVATSRNNLALVLWDLGRPAEAEPLLRTSLTSFRTLYEQDNRQIADALGNLSLVVRDQGRLEEAEQLARETLDMYRRVAGDDSPEVAVALNNLARLAVAQGELADAATLYRESLALRRKLYGDEHPRVARVLNNLAATLHEQDQLGEAETYFRKSLAMHRSTLPDRHPNIAWPLTGLGEVLIDRDRPEEAEVLLREALELRVAALPEGDWRTGISRSLLGECLFAQGRFVEAEPLVLGGFAEMNDEPASGEKRTRQALARIVRLYESWNRPDQAAEYRRQLDSAAPGPT